MMKSKEEVIREAWGEHYNTVRNHLLDNGFVKVGTWHNNKPIDFEIMDIDFETDIVDIPFGYFSETIEYVRPKSLQGIENNNAWIKIESEDDLPKENLIMCFVMDKIFPNKIYIKEFNVNKKEYWVEIITHYQILKYPNPPL